MGIEDINEHHNRLFWLDANKQEQDDMLERFIHTFLGDYEPESEDTKWESKNA